MRKKRRNANIEVPYYAKISAKLGLMGYAKLTTAEAKKRRKGKIVARVLMHRKRIDKHLAKEIGRAYMKVRRQRTKGAEVALNLYGGRKFGYFMARKYYK